MRTPAGKECPYFYGDYYRGRNHEECRLLPGGSPERTWTRDLCQSCPVPEIAQANSCEHMVLEASVERRFLGLKRQVVVEARCEKCACTVENPFVGCGQCHPAIFFVDPGE